MSRRKLSAEQLSRSNLIKQKFLEWLEERIEEQRPVSYRFASRLIEAYAHSLGIPQKTAKEMLLEWGLDRVIIFGPHQENFPSPGSISYNSAIDLWRRRDLEIQE